MKRHPLLSVKDLRVEFPSRRGVLTAIDGISFTQNHAAVVSNAFLERTISLPVLSKRNAPVP